MHIPDGFIDAPVSAAAGVIAVAGIAISLQGARRQLDERTAPLAGLVAVFVFAAQMLNFPVAAGTSGHLLGGALAAILVGPWAGALAVSVVLVVQALVFADGGLSALGLNIINMAFVTVLVGWPVFRLLARVLPRRRSSWVAAAFVGGFLSVPASAVAFTLEYAIGGTGTFSNGTVLLAMVGTHLLIGLGEGVITALTVGAVLAVRADLVYGVHDLRPAPAVGSAGSPAGAPQPAGRGSGPWGFLAVGLALSVVLAGVVSFYASAAPDGLEKVAEDQGFLASAEDSAVAGSPLADYGVAGVSDERFSVGLAGLIGVLIMVAVAFVLFWWIGRRRGASSGAANHRHGHDVGERLYVHRHTPLHLMPAEAKVIALVAFIFVVVATPAQQYWAFGVYAALLVAVAAVARVPATVILPRMVVEVPFLLFAVLMPFFGPDPTVEVLGLSLSQPGLVAAWGIIAKATLGVVGAILLAATTPTRDLLMGLERLHVPPMLVQIAAFMMRYTHVVTDEMSRMRVARESRGFEATGVRSWPTVAQSAGALFIRSYERGERVHLAMLSRGYTGTMPVLDRVHATSRDWTTALTLPAVALVVCLAAWAVQR
ncbi:MAG: cobalt ECF transporter T component CbiQ [Candidatus Nanopelagicales bacterium]